MKRSGQLFPVLAFLIAGGRSEAQELLNLTIEKAVLLAVENSIELQTAGSEIKFAEKYKSLAAFNRLPSVDISCSHGNTVNIQNSDSSSNYIALKLTHKLFDGGSASVRNKIESFSLRIQQEEYEQARTALENGIRLDYNRLLVMDLQIDLKRKTLQQAEEQLKICRMEAGFGSITELDLLQTEIIIRRLELEISALLAKKEEAVSGFIKSLGLPQTIRLALQETGIADYQGIRLSIPEEQIALMALESSNEYRKACLERERLSHEIFLAERAFLPLIDLEITAAISGADFPLSEPSFGIALGIDFGRTGIPFSGTVSAGQSGEYSRNRKISASTGTSGIGKAHLALEKLKMGMKETSGRIEQMELSISRLAVFTYNSCLRKKEEIDLKRKIILLREKELAILELRLQQGGLKRSELIEAETALSADRIDLLESILDLLQTEQQFAISVGMATPLTAVSPGGI